MRACTLVAAEHARTLTDTNSTHGGGFILPENLVWLVVNSAAGTIIAVIAIIAIITIKPILY